MMKFLVVLCVSLVLLKVVSSALPGNAKATYNCDDAGGANVLKVTYNFNTMVNGDSTGDPFKALFVKGQSGDAACKIERPAPANAADTSIEVAITVPACGLALAGTTLAANAVFYLTARTDGVFQSTDQQLTIPAASCDFAALAPATVNITDANDITIDSTNLPVGTITELIPPVTLRLIDASNGDITGCQLGDPVKLKLTADISGGLATGVHATSCTATPVGGGSGSLTFLTASCTTGVVGSGTNDGFTYDGTNSVSGTSYISVMTSKFDCFGFDGTTQMSLACVVDFCSSAITAPISPAIGNLCQIGADQCVLTSGGGGQTLHTRKRRDVGTHNLNETKVSLTINIGQPTEANANSASGKGAANGLCSGLLHQSTFIATVSILAVLLLVSMAISAFSIKKARNARENNIPPPYAVKGAENPTF